MSHEQGEGRPSITDNKTAARNVVKAGTRRSTYDHRNGHEKRQSEPLSSVHNHLRLAEHVYGITHWVLRILTPFQGWMRGEPNQQL